jgi:hypothetical protein
MDYSSLGVGIEWRKQVPKGVTLKGISVPCLLFSNSLHPIGHKVTYFELSCTFATIFCLTMGPK